MDTISNFLCVEKMGWSDAYICAHYLAQASLPFDEAAKAAALRFASERGGRSGRVAYQFSRSFIGIKNLEK